MNKKFSFIALVAIVLGLGFASCNSNMVTDIDISDAKITLLIGGTDSIAAEAKYTGDIVPALVWSSSNPEVVSVKDGTIKALKKGVATISVKAGTKTATCEVTVTDEVVTTFTKGEMWYFGDAYGTEKSNNFLVLIATSGIDLYNFSGDGEILQLEFNSSLSNTTGIDNGTYKFVDLEIEKFDVKTLVPGFVDDYDESWGGWYFGAIESDLVSGEVTVTKKSNNVYELVYEITDGYGNKIAGIYNAALTYVDATQQGDAVQAEKANKMKKALNRKVNTRLF